MPTSEQNLEHKLFYLYGKNICNCKWELIGRFNKKDAEDFMDKNNYHTNKSKRYLSFQVSLTELSV